MKKKTKSRLLTKKRFLVAAAVLVLAASAALTLQWQRDKRRHALLDKSMDELVTALRQNGFDDAEKNSGCGRTQVKYGGGAKVCSNSVSYRASVNEEGLAGDLYVKFHEVLSFTDFTPTSPLRGFNPSNGVDFGTDRYIHKPTKLNCNSYLSFSLSDSGLYLDLSCRL